LDLEKLRLESATKDLGKTSSKKPPRPRQGDKFLKGPIPLNWLMEAANQPGKALSVAIALWYLSGLKRSCTVALSISSLMDFGVGRLAGYRGLAALEQARLVSVVRHPGRKPIVTLLDAVKD
jgi:hypothetical protein